MYLSLLTSIADFCSNVRSVRPAERCSLADSRVSSFLAASRPAKSGCDFKISILPAKLLNIYNKCAVKGHKTSQLRI